MLSCTDVLAELSDYLDNELTSELRRELELHLAQCRTCEVLYDSTHKTLRIVTESRSFGLPEGLARRISKQVIRKLRSGQKPDP